MLELSGEKAQPNLKDYSSKPALPMVKNIRNFKFSGIISRLACAFPDN